MRNPSPTPGRWLDVVMLPAAGALLLPVVVVALAPVLFTLMVLWPLLVLPVLAVPRSLPVGEPRRPTGQRTPRVRELDPTRQLPQAA